MCSQKCCKFPKNIIRKQTFDKMTNDFQVPIYIKEFPKKKKKCQKIPRIKNISKNSMTFTYRRNV